MLVSSARAGPISNPAQVNKPKRPRMAIKALTLLVTLFGSLMVSRRMATPNKIGNRVKTIVKTAEKSGPVAAKAKIIWVNIIAPLPKYRRPAETPVTLKISRRMARRLQIESAKPMTRAASIGARIKPKD